MIEQILKIRLQFEELTSAAKAKEDATLADMEGKANKSLQRMAKAGGDETIRTMTRMSEAWQAFDWAHPIQSLKGLWEGFAAGIEARLGRVAGGIVLGILGLIGNAFKQTLDAQDEMVKMFVQLQDTVSFIGDKGVRSVSNFGDKIATSISEISGLAMITGENFGEIAKHYAALGKMRVPVQDLRELTKLSYLGAKALGANVDQFTEFMGHLRVQGKLTPAQLGSPNGLLGSLLKIQSATGLTENEMSILMQTVTKNTQRMAAFGASQKDILAMSEATAKLVAMFGKLGLGADRAGQFMDKLMDPAQIGENALAIRQMGFSMGEFMQMMKGGAVDQDKLTEGMVRMADQVAELAKSTDNVYAINARAQMLGFSNMQEALRISQEGHKALQSMADGTADINKKAAEGMASLKDAWKRLTGMATGALAKPLAHVIGTLTNVLAGLNKWMLEHGPEIEKFLDGVINGFVDWIKKIDWKQVIESGKAFFHTVGNIIKVLVKLAPVLGVVAGALLAFKFLGPLFGMGGKGGGIFGSVGKGISQMGEGMKGAGKLLIGAAALLLVAGALYVTALAVEKFGKVDWGAMLKAGVALLVLAGLMIGIGFLFAALPEAAAGMIIFGAALLMVAGSMLMFAKALQMLEPDKIKQLASLASPQLILQFLELGAAFAAMLAPLLFIPGTLVLKLIGVSKAIKDLAVGLYVLSKVPDIKTMTSSLKDVRDVISTMDHMKFQGNAASIGAAFRELSSSIIDLTKVDTKSFIGLGKNMEGLGEGIGAWMVAMKKGAAFKFLGIGKDLGEVSKGFKDMAVGMYVLAAAGEKMDKIQKLMTHLPDMVETMSKAMDRFEKSRRGAELFTQTLREMQTAAMGMQPVNVPVTGQLTGVEGSGTQSLTASFATEIAKVVDAVNKLNASVTDNQQAQMTALTYISQYTKRMANK